MNFMNHFYKLGVCIILKLNIKLFTEIEDKEERVLCLKEVIKDTSFK